MSKLSDAELNEAIAKAVGWKNIEVAEPLASLKYRYVGTDPLDPLCHINIPGKGPAKKYVPDFCNDLNACHEVEQWLRKQDRLKSVKNRWRSYWLHLMQDLNPDVKLWDNGAFLGDWSHAIKVGEATARQRAEALHEVLKGGK